MSRIRLVLALGAFFVLAGTLAACGSSVSGGSVASVAGHQIARADFDHWVAVYAKQSSQAPGQPVVVPDPPNYTKCMAARSALYAKAPKGVPRPKPDALKKQCEQQYTALRDRALNLLLQAQWIEGEAKDQGISATDAEVRKALDQIKKQQFHTEAQFQQFIKQSGMSLSDILFQERIDVLSQKLKTKILARAGKVTPADVTTYYNAHKAQFGSPEARDARIVLSQSNAKALAALKALRSGQPFAKVVKKYSTDPQTKASGGLLPSITLQGQQQQDRALTMAVFSSPKGKLRGPLKGSFGFYVFEVVKITKATQQSESQAAASARQQLLAQREQTTLGDFVKQFRKKWTARTDCRKEFVIYGCKGGPKNPPASPSQPGASGSPTG